MAMRFKTFQAREALVRFELIRRKHQIALPGSVCLNTPSLIRRSFQNPNVPNALYQYRNALTRRLNLDRDNVFGVTLRKFLSPVAHFLDDPSVSEIMINGPTEVYIEQAGRIEKTDVAFDDEELLHAAARNIAQYTNKRVDSLTARFDSRLPDGSRVHVVMPRCSRKGLCIAIRKFSN